MNSNLTQCHPCCNANLTLTLPKSNRYRRFCATKMFAKQIIIIRSICFSDDKQVLSNAELPSTKFCIASNINRTILLSSESCQFRFLTAENNHYFRILPFVLASRSIYFLAHANQHILKTSFQGNFAIKGQWILKDRQGLTCLWT